MEAIFKGIIDYFLNFIARYSYFFNWDYYSGLFSKYFSLGGFIIGFIFVLLVYFSSAEEQKKAGFFKVLSIIAVINCCVVIANFLDTTFNQGFKYDGIELMINASDNIISGFILTLVVFSCYKKFSGRAFLLGITTHLALPLLNFTYFENIGDSVPMFHMSLRIVLVGFVCLIISRRKYFFTSWIWYFCFHLLIRVAVFFLPLLIDYLNGTDVHTIDYTLNSAITYFSRFAVDGVLFVVILVFAIVFEKSVLTVSQSQKAT